MVALAVTREGFPVRSWVFPGNTADVTRIPKIRADLKGWKLHRSLFVADAGFNSEANPRELAKACGHDLLATRLSSCGEVKREVLGRAGRYKNLENNLKGKEVIVGEGERRRRSFLCLNPKEAEREKRRRAEVVAFLERELKAHKSRAATQAWAVELLASKRTKRFLAVRRGKICLDRAAIKAAERTDGKWVVQTNDDSLTLEDGARGYKSLLVIERCFRTLKRTEIRMGPVHHWLSRRIEAHVKICVLALLIERMAEHLTGVSWRNLRHDLRKLQAAKFSTKSHDFWQRNEVSAETTRILSSLGIKTPRRILEVLETAPNL